jgi:hypothetical protein
VTDEDPISYMALQPGTEVFTVDGTPIGTVEHVLQVPDLDLFDGIVIAVPRGIRFIDRDSITSMTTSRVNTSLTASDAAQLPEPEGSPVFHVNSLQDVGPDLTDRLGRMFRRRHWIKDE